MDPWLVFNITFIFSNPLFVRDIAKSNTNNWEDQLLRILEVCKTSKYHIPSAESGFDFSVPLVFNQLFSSHVAGISIPEYNCIIVANMKYAVSPDVVAHELAHFFWAVHLKHTYKEIACLRSEMKARGGKSIMYPYKWHDFNNVGENNKPVVNNEHESSNWRHVFNTSVQYLWSPTCYNNNHTRQTFTNHLHRRNIFRFLKQLHKLSRSSSYTDADIDSVVKSSNFTPRFRMQHITSQTSEYIETCDDVIDV